MCIQVDVSFSDNAANFYNLANANRTQISKEYKLKAVGYNKEMGLKDVFYQRITTHESDTRETYTLFQLPSLPCLPLKIGVAISFHQLRCRIHTVLSTSYALC